MNKPVVSDKFDLEDIRKIREYNSLRFAEMSPAEIVAETKASSSELMDIILHRATANSVMIVSDDNLSPTPVHNVS